MSFAQPPKRKYTSRRKVTRTQYYADHHRRRLVYRYALQLLGRRADVDGPGHVTTAELPPYLTAQDRADIEDAYFEPSTTASYQKCNTCRYRFKTHASGAVDLKDVREHKLSHTPCWCGGQHIPVQFRKQEIRKDSETMDLHQVAFTRRDANFTTPGLRYAITSYGRTGRSQGEARW